MFAKKIEKVLLIWPYFERKSFSDIASSYDFPPPRFPLGIGYLASYLRESGIEVEILDCFAEAFPTETIVGDKVRIGLSDSEITQRILEYSPQLVGVSQMFTYLMPCCENIFSLVKHIDPSIITMWGGTQPTVDIETCLKCEDADFIVKGEGEAPLLEFIRRHNAGESYEGMKALAYRNSHESFISDERHWIDNLDDHVLPARDLVDMKLYDEDMGVFNMVTSRGCPYSCTFCTAPTFYQKRFNARSPATVVDEMEMLVNDYGAKQFRVEDENLTFDMDRIEQILDLMIERNVEVKWFAQVGLTISRLNRTIIKKMKQTGFTELRLALESGDPETLKMMKKPLVLNRARKVMEEAREEGMRCISFLMMGMPGETLEQLNNTVEFADTIGFDWNIINMVLPLPGSKIHEDLVAAGKSFEAEDIERYSLPVEGVSEIDTDTLLAFKDNANNRLNYENNFNLTRGSAHKAVSDFLTIQRRYPNLPKVSYYLGLAYEKLGEIDNAKKAFQRTWQLDPAFKDVSARI